MARTSAPGSRDRILDNAGRLFREHGARAVGMQQIVDECGCGKNLLYREFPSKDELVAAYLERCQREWNGIMDSATRPYAGDPAGALVALVRAVVDQVTAPDFRGCPFRIAYAEFPDPNHPAHRVALRHVTQLRSRLRRLASRARAKDPRALSDRIMLIIDGLYVNGAMLGRRGAATKAVALVEELVQSATGIERHHDGAGSRQLPGRTEVRAVVPGGMDLTSRAEVDRSVERQSRVQSKEPGRR